MRDLQPDNPDSEVDKVVKFILDQNIPVRYLGIKFNKLTSTKCHRRAPELIEIAKANPKLKFVRMRPGKDGEGEIIRTNWEKLMGKVQVVNRGKCYSDFFLHRINLPRKRNVLGCYLGQNLPYIRLAPTIIRFATEVLGNWNTGTFTKEEDRIILFEVKKNGATSRTWQKLGAILNRIGTETVFKRYTLLTVSKIYSGKWQLSEDSLLLGHLFQGKRDSSADSIRNISNFGSKFSKYLHSLERKC